eukprot:c53172_g1_i1.p1 GENE.c53172_g1_i1~~c53172_g1_i1.p1  ORF type:complete len:226 (-),score=32.71 c53172_g1_i1:57-653(-)
MARCTFLIQASLSVMSQSKKLSSWLYDQVERVSTQQGFEISKGVSQKFCRLCCTPLVAGWSADSKVRRLSRKQKNRRKNSGRVLNEIVMTCRECKHTNVHDGTTSKVLAKRRTAHTIATKGTELSDRGQFFVDVPKKRAEPSSVSEGGDKKLSRSVRQRRQKLQALLDSQNQRINTAVAASQGSANSSLKSFLESLQK